jgi:hypothetical protein
MYVILEIVGKPSVVLESDVAVITLMQQYGAQRAFVGDAYDPAIIEHNHLQSMREYSMWAVAKPTEGGGYDLLGLSHLPVIDPVEGEVVCLKLTSETALENGEYATKSV